MVEYVFIFEIWFSWLFKFGFLIGFFLLVVFVFFNMIIDNDFVIFGFDYFECVSFGWCGKVDDRFVISIKIWCDGDIIWVLVEIFWYSLLYNFVVSFGGIYLLLRIICIVWVCVFFFFGLVLGLNVKVVMLVCWFFLIIFCWVLLVVILLFGFWVVLIVFCCLSFVVVIVVVMVVFVYMLF